MKKPFKYATLSLLLTALVIACAPPSVQQPQAPPAAPSPSASGAKVAPPSSNVSPEEAAWQKTLAAAQKEAKVIVYAAGYTGETGIQMRSAFKARYNVDLDIIIGRGAEFTERMRTERRMGQMVGDVIQSSSTLLTGMKNLDLLDPVPGLPALRNKADFHVEPFLDKEGYILIHGFQLIGPMVNTKLVKPGEEPKRWQDMLDPK